MRLIFFRSRKQFFYWKLFFVVKADETVTKSEKKQHFLLNSTILVNFNNNNSVSVSTEIKLEDICKGPWLESKKRTKKFHHSTLSSMLVKNWFKLKESGDWISKLKCEVKKSKKFFVVHSDSNQIWYHNPGYS